MVGVGIDVPEQGRYFLASGGKKTISNRHLTLIHLSDFSIYDNQMSLTVQNCTDILPEIMCYRMLLVFGIE